MLAKNDLLDYLADHYGTCDRDKPKRNDCYWGKDARGNWNGCLKVGGGGRGCKHWRPLPPEQLDEMTRYFDVQ